MISYRLLIFFSERIRIESTSFTVSEPVGTYTIEPLIYKYALDETTIEVKNYYGNEFFDMEDVIKIS